MFNFHRVGGEEDAIFTIFTIFVTQRMASEWRVRGEFKSHTQSLNTLSHFFYFTDAAKPLGSLYLYKKVVQQYSR